MKNQEIDYIEEEGGSFSGFEFKFNKNTFKKAEVFLKTYKNSSLELVNKENYKSFLKE
jgi:hypothetical protein